MTRAFVSIGSNIDPETNVRRAVLRLAETTRVTAISTVYRTEPLGSEDQPPFYNCVIELETDLSPRDLKFRLLRPVESELGRIRGADKFAARTIDLDLILYDDLVMTAEDLTLPDPDILKRPFLALPLQEVAPGLVLPGSGLRIRETGAVLQRMGMAPLEDYTARIRKEIFRERKR